MTKWNWFEAFGIELEYVLVDAESFDVRAVADRLLERLAGGPACDVEGDGTTWSNELTNHVLELKSTEPLRSLADGEPLFRDALRRLSPDLQAMGLALLPAGMHPWMDPAVETELWPGEGQEIYQTYDRIFDCRRHGWANVQSVHLNLPFAGDDQFRRLHAAVRLVLPLLPALAASSPVTDSRPRDTLDTRVIHYARHCDEIPEMIGDVIPEAVDGEVDYRRQILDPIAAAVGPRDPDGSMRVEFLNARGAIARFDRGSIEIRLMDVQEYPAADLAVCAAAVTAIRRLADETWSSFEEQQAIPTATLRRLLDATATDAEQTPIDDEGYLRVLGIDDVPSRGSMPIRASHVWRSLLERGAPEGASLAEFAEPLGVILDRGPLARRIRQRLGSRFTRDHLAATYRDVAECLDTWHPFRP